MLIFLVTYDLNSPVNDYGSLYHFLDNLPISIRIAESSYAIGTSMSAEELWQTLAQLIKRDDMLFIIQLGANWHGQGGRKHQDLADLLNKYLPVKR